VYLSPTDRKKLLYADSTAYAALRSNRNEMISCSFQGNGIFCYFNFKQFETDLTEYLKAYEYSEYLKQKRIYHLSLVKVIWLLQRSADLFKEYSVFLKENQRKGRSNRIFNFRR
jgi:hypothetical protein